MTVKYSRATYSARRPPNTLAIMGHPIYLMLDHFPIACFTLTLLSDIIYWRSANLLWHGFSEWLLLAGLLFGGLELLALLIDLVFGRALRATGYGWPFAFGLLIVLALATLNSFIHAADGWVGVVPWGLTLSVVTFVAMVLTAWFRREMEFQCTTGGYRND